MSETDKLFKFGDIVKFNLRTDSKEQLMWKILNL